MQQLIAGISRKRKHSRAGKIPAKRSAPAWINTCKCTNYIPSEEQPNASIKKSKPSVFSDPAAGWHSLLHPFFLA
jgi:hypothetical protein